MLAELQGKDGRALDVLPPTLKSGLPDRFCCSCTYRGARSSLHKRLSPACCCSRKVPVLKHCPSRCALASIWAIRSIAFKIRRRRRVD